MDIEIFNKIKNEFRRYYDKNIEKLKIVNDTIDIKNEKYSEIISDNKIFYRKINIEGNCEISININVEKDKYIILYDEIYVNKNSTLNYIIKGKIKGTLYNYLYVVQEENSKSNIEERFSNYGKLYNISKINIPKGSKNSEGNLKSIILQSDESFSMVLPILNIEDPTSRGFHGAKVIKITDEQLFYLYSKGINKKDILRIVEESLLL